MALRVSWHWISDTYRHKFFHYYRKRIRSRSWSSSKILVLQSSYFLFCLVVMPPILMLLSLQNLVIWLKLIRFIQVILECCLTVYNSIQSLRCKKFLFWFLNRRIVILPKDMLLYNMILCYEKLILFCFVSQRDM